MFSVTLYLITFILAILFTNIAERQLNKNHRRWFIIFSFIAIMIPCIVAGIRADTVGTDVRVYVKPYLFRAQSTGSFMEMYALSSTSDIGYIFLVYFVSRIGGNLNTVLFLTELLVFLPIYIVAFKHRNVAPMHITIMTYLFLFYNMSFNSMRQCIAASFILLSYFIFNEKKYVKFSLLAVVSILFHNSSYIGLLFVLIAQYALKEKNKKRRYIVLTLFILFVVSIFGNIEGIASSLINLGVLSSRFMKYIEIFGISSSGDSSFFQYVTIDVIIVNFLKLFLLLIPFYFCKRRKRENEFFTISLISMLGVSVYILFFFLYHTLYGYRLSLFAEYFMILFMPYAYKPTTKSSGLTISMGTAVSTISMLIYWYLMYIAFGWHQTVPYVISIL